jgi:uncharacterized membrane protein
LPLTTPISMRKINREKALDLAAAAGIGAIAGLRSMTAPALVAVAINQHRLDAPSGKLGFLKSKKAASILTVLAIGELIADKLPFTPDRTKPAGLATRIASGALAASALCASRRRSITTGAIIGGLGAVAGTFLGYSARQQVNERLHVRDAVPALVEDAIAVGGGALLVAR